MWGDDASAVLAVLAYSGACFCAGVAWAAYRAVGWTERIRRWAHSEPTP
jgi:hypothetical protein